MSSHIEWNKARHLHEQHQIQEKKHKEALIEEFKTMHLSGHSAMDINIYAAEAGIEPNEVRRLMIHDEDANVDFIDEIQSFEDDETDSIIDYF